MTASTAPPVPLPNARVALYNFVQDRLTAVTGQSLAAFILERRQPGAVQPYRHIASEIVTITGVDITHEAVRRWYYRAVDEAESAAVADAQAKASALLAPFSS